MGVADALQGDRLLGSAAEIDAISQLFPNSDILKGAEASEEQIQMLVDTNRLQSYTHLHFALHAQANDTDPLQSSVLLTPANSKTNLTAVLNGDGSAFDGKVTARQILRTWRLDADLVVLSACETMRGRPSDSEGDIGFTQALLVAGTRSVVLSHWKVDDQATRLLMARFYHNLLARGEDQGVPMGVADALHEAKLWLRQLPSDEIDQHDLSTLVASRSPSTVSFQRVVRYRRFNHPYHWAGFVVVGDF